ncbi:type II secretion system protein N [Caulobacter sp. NIBR1757]|uniref:type II secretion system protein N n=1 Tax=Caulobacter sp. NIBR1757 TaxID=3016000 RepID=UPI0022F06B28|nr:type II secretion system protein N [Caulobacter sp. NIBR1757]
MVWQRLLPGGFTTVSARAVVEAMLVLLLATQAARLVWAVAAPGAPPPASARAQMADLSILTRFNPFLGLDTPTGGQASGQAMRLYGVRAGLDGRGSAIIGTADGKQASYLVGETVAPGVTLQAVHDNHVVLARGAATTRLTFPDGPQ